MIVAGASAYSRQIHWYLFREIADEVGAYLLCDMAHYSGLIKMLVDTMIILFITQMW